MTFENRDVPYFEFKHIEVDGSVSVKRFEAMTWKEAHEKFWEFLNGCGYIIDRNVGDTACEAAEQVHKESIKDLRGRWVNEVTDEFL